MRTFVSFMILTLALLVVPATVSAEGYDDYLGGSGTVTAMVAGPGNTVLAATDTGLYLLDETSRMTRSWTVLDGLPQGGFVGMGRLGDHLYAVDHKRLVSVALAETMTLSKPVVRLPFSSKRARIERLVEAEGALWILARREKPIRLSHNDDGELSAVAMGPRLTHIRAATSVGGSLAVLAGGGNLTMCDAMGCSTPEDAVTAHALVPHGDGVVLAGANRFQACTPTACRSFEAFGTDTKPSSVRDLAPHPTGALALTQSGDVQILGEERPRFFGAVPPLSRPTLVSVNGQILVGGRGKLFRVQLRRAPTSVALGQLPSRDVSSVARDHLGRTWIGTFDGGVAVVGADRTTKLMGLESLPSLEVNHVAHQGTDVFVSTTAGLALFDQYLVPQAVPTLDCRDVHVTMPEGDNVWMGSRCGLYRWNRKTDEMVRFERPQGLPNISVFTLAVHQGTLYVGTFDGLASRALNADDDVPFVAERRIDGTLPDSWITSLASSGDALFVGTYSGGIQVRRGDDRKALPGIRRVNLNAMSVATDGTFFVGGLEEGMFVSHDGGRTLVSANRQLPGDDVTSVIIDDAGMVVATRHGAVFRGSK